MSAMSGAWGRTRARSTAVNRAIPPRSGVAGRDYLGVNPAASIGISTACGVFGGPGPHLGPNGFQHRRRRRAVLQEHVVVCLKLSCALLKAFWCLFQA